MVTRVNHALNPALKNDGATWFGPSGWARTTSAHATLPRTTAFGGTTPGAMQPSRASDVTPGQYVVWSASVRFVAPSTGFVNIDWKTSGSTYLSTTTGPAYNVTGGTTVRLVSGVGLAPASAGIVQPNLTGVDGELQITAVLIEYYASEAAAIADLANHATAGHYFDGDTANAVWNGTNGNSTSTLTVTQPVTLTAALAGPVAHMVAIRQTTAVLAANLLGPIAAIGLFVTVSYDERRGRFRISASGMPDEVVRVVVDSRPLGSTRYRAVRGGRVAVTNGSTVRTVDDYEFAAGKGMQYRLVALSSPENSPDVIVTTRVVTVADTLDESWVKFIATPYRNRRVEVLVDPRTVARRSRIALFDVQGRSDPVAVTDVHTGRSMAVRLVTRSAADRDALDDALRTGQPIFLQTPDSVPIPSMYAVVGDYEYTPPGARSPRSIFTVALTEVAAPPVSVVGTGLTYSVLGTQYGAYADLSDQVDTYADIGGA